MKKGLAVGCIVWVLLFTVMGACLVPVGLMVAGFTSQTDFVVETVGRYLCPEGTTPGLYIYATTIRDERGVDMPATASELICLDASGETVANLGPTYAFLWSGVLGVVGAVVAAVVSILLAGPIGAVIGRRLGRKAGTA